MAGPTTSKSGEIQKRNTGGTSLASMVQKMGPEIARALPKHVTADRITRIALTALRTTPKLAQCTPESFLGCVMQTAQLGLEVNTPLGLAYLIPRKNNRRGGILECTVIIGYQGFIELAMRSGRVSGIYAHVVREGDEFDYELGLAPTLTHKPSGDADREDKKITHVYSVARIKDADPVFVVLTEAQVAARRARNRESHTSPWKSDLEAMTLKTAIRALWRWLPKSSEMATAVAVDVATDQGKDVFGALDADVSEALGKQGLLPEDAGHDEDGVVIDAEYEEGDTPDAESGEMGAEEQAQMEADERAKQEG